MITRKTLGVLALVLVAVFSISKIVARVRSPEAKGGGFVTLLEGVDPGRISSVRAWLGTDEEDAVELQRSSDGWIVASEWGWPAKDDTVQELLDNFSRLGGELRSTSSAVLADYRIDDENGLHVVAKGDGGSELLHLVVGKSSSRGGCFVREEGSDSVYLATVKAASSPEGSDASPTISVSSAGQAEQMRSPPPKSLRAIFGMWGDEPKPPESKRWIDLRIYRAERNDVDKVVLKDGGRELVLEKRFEPPAEEGGEVDRTKWTWKPDADGELDKNRTDGVVSTLCNLYANDVVEPGDLERYGLGEGARSAELTFADGTVQTIWFGSKGGEDDKFVYFRVGDGGDPAEIHASTVDRIFVDRSELQPAKG